MREMIIKVALVLGFFLLYGLVGAIEGRPDNMEQRIVDLEHKLMIQNIEKARLERIIKGDLYIPKEVKK